MVTTTRSDETTVFLCDQCIADGDGQWGVGWVAADAECARCSGQPAMSVFFSSVQQPRLNMDGGYAVEFSTCVDLADALPHDVNGYYAELGIHPRASRREIKQRYLDLRGWESVRLTFIVKQLMNPSVRAAYDASPYGYAFWDEWVAEDERKRVMEELRRGGVDVLSEEIQEAVEEIIRLLDYEEVSSRSSKNGWGHYEWQPSARYHWDKARWIDLLASELRGRVPPISVGRMGTHMAEPWAVTREGYRVVVWLRDRENPSRWAASAAAEARAMFIDTEG